MNGTNLETSAIFDEEHLQARLEVIRQHVSRPIPKQPWDDSSPALIPFHDGGDDVCSNSSATAAGGGIIIGGARHASNIPLLQSMNVTAVLNCASGVRISYCLSQRLI